MCLWFAEDYMEYAAAIIIMSLLSISLTVYDLRQVGETSHLSPQGGLISNT